MVEDICGNYPQWAPDETTAPEVISLLGGGSRNASIRLRGRGAEWVLRIAPSTTPPGVCREREYHVHQAAAQAGIAPEIVYAEHRRGILVTKYLPSESGESSPGLLPSAKAEKDPGQAIQSLAGLLRRIHSLPVPIEITTPITHLQRAVNYLPDDHDLPVSPDAIYRELAKALAEAGSGPWASTLCHNDLLSANRIEISGQLFAIDWEYASGGDPFFDLAVCASELEPQHVDTLLGHYLQRRPSAEEQQRFSILRQTYAFIAASWHAAFDPQCTAAEAARETLLRMLNRGFVAA